MKKKGAEWWPLNIAILCQPGIGANGHASFVRIYRKKMMRKAFRILLVLTVLTSGHSRAWAQGKSKVFVRVKVESVKLFRQPTSSSEVLKVLSRMDMLQVLRAQNPAWTIVISDTVGYVLTSELDWRNSHTLFTPHVAGKL